MKFIFNTSICLFIIVILISCSSEQEREQLRESLCIRDTLKQYYPSGNLKSIEPFCNKVKDGIAWFYKEDGSQDKMFSYREGVLNGKCLHFFGNGSVELECYFKNDKLDSVYKIFDESGKVVRKLQYKNGVAAN